MVKIAFVKREIKENISWLKIHFANYPINNSLILLAAQVNQP